MRSYDELLDLDQTIAITFNPIHVRMNILVTKTGGRNLVANKLEQMKMEINKKIDTEIYRGSQVK
jgi:hypothetical protein